MGTSGSKRIAKPAQPLELYAAKESAPSRAVWFYLVQVRTGVVIESHHSHETGDVLLQSKVPFELKVVDVLKGETKSDEFTKLNPHQCVPVLKDGELMVRER